MDIEKEIKETLEDLKSDDYTTFRSAVQKMQTNTESWLRHQASIISQQSEEIIRQRKYIAFLQVCNRTREPWEGTINDFFAKENPHVNT